MANRNTELDVLYDTGVEEALQNPEGADWARLYRLGVMRAFQRIPHKSLPEDRAACGVMASALESMGWILFIVTNRHGQVYFTGEGVDYLFSWLNRCRALFEHLTRIASDLPSGRDGENIGLKAAAMSVECNELFCQLADAVSDDEPGCNGADILAVAADTFTRIAAGLAAITTHWLVDSVADNLIQEIGACNIEISQWRALTSDESASKGS